MNHENFTFTSRNRMDFIHNVKSAKPNGLDNGINHDNFLLWLNHTRKTKRVPQFNESRFTEILTAKPLRINLPGWGNTVSTLQFLYLLR